MLLTVHVPEGLAPGDSMCVEAGGQTFTIVVPDDVYAGMSLEVDLPVDVEQPQTQQVELVVPDGIGPGDAFSVEAEWGEVFEITCPDGSAAGQTILIELPCHLSKTGHQSSCRRSMKWRMEPPPHLQRLTMVGTNSSLANV